MESEERIRETVDELLNERHSRQEIIEALHTLAAELRLQQMDDPEDER